MSRILEEFVKRNPSFQTQSARSKYAVRKAIVMHKRANPACAVTGRRFGYKIEVHHKLPVSTRPDLAADPGNLVTLTWAVHRYLAHPLGCRSSYCANIDAVIDTIQIQMTEAA